MNINYIGQNIEVTPGIKEHTQKKFAKIAKHSTQVEAVNVSFHLENREHIAKATIHLPKTDLFAHHSSEDLYKSIDFLTTKLITKLDKHHDIMQSSKKNSHNKDNNL
jgi:putative sigma-54 modulation protein|tara:strand:- start:643 stop:963 length:321 start_codon:yes stop_codon:yes gene_type:complete